MLNRRAMLGPIVLALAFTSISIRDSGAATHPPLTTPGGVVSADNEQASQVGASVLRKGGNAIDAAIATAFALGVVHPASSGIGGGGFAIVYVAKERRAYAFDFREVGPEKISPESFVRNGVLMPELARNGGLAVAVPGEVAGLDQLSKRFGQLPWRDVVMPSVRLADNGFELSWFLHTAISRWLPRSDKRSRLAKVLASYSESRPGNKVTRRHLAGTLRRIARERSAGFYRGPVADDIVETVSAGGGVLSHRDLRNYRPIERVPLKGRWRGFDVVTMPPPSSGGIAILEALGIIEATRIDLASLGAGSSSALHVIVEALKHAFADRARFLGGVQSSSVVNKLLDPARLRRLARRISLRRTGPPRRYGDRDLGLPVAAPADGGTSHLCVVDSQGNAVALTTTVNTYFGSGLLTEQSGVVLNNEIDDFSLAPGQANAFGLVQSRQNLVGPGKKPLSSMSPTLLLRNGRVAACAGGSGGPRIISNTLQALLNVFVFGMDARAAVSVPRVHHQWSPNQVVTEAEMVGDVKKGLERKGHRLRVSPYATAVQIIVVDEEGMRRAASDPRKGGLPAAAP